jgi:hypothetical protein
VPTPGGSPTGRDLVAHAAGRGLISYAWTLAAYLPGLSRGESGLDPGVTRVVARLAGLLLLLPTVCWTGALLELRPLPTPGRGRRAPDDHLGHAFVVLCPDPPQQLILEQVVAPFRKRPQDSICRLLSRCQRVPAGPQLSRSQFCTQATVAS